MGDTVLAGPAPESPLLRSRSLAVRRLAGGGGALLTGVVAAGAALLVPTTVGGGLPVLALFGAGVLAAALGGSRMSLAAAHLWRFGDRRSLWVPVSAGGLGLSAGSLGVAVLGPLTGLWSFGGEALLLEGLLGTAGFRTRLIPREDGTVRQVTEYSQDGGASWEPCSTPSTFAGRRASLALG